MLGAVGVARKDQLQAQVAAERAAQELEALLATSRHLLEEMQQLIDTARKLQEEHAETLAASKTARSRYKSR